MNENVCNDNRFNLIAKYKAKLIEATNIETSQDEMAVIDNILFRMWQMGWLDKLDAASPWHRVEDGLPNFSGKVLVNIKPVVSCDSDRFETAYYNCLMSVDVDPKTFWQYDYENDCIVDITKYVTHWMAVEPPKEDA